MTDLPDLIAGATGVSRGTAYDMMRECLAEVDGPADEPVAWMDVDHDGNHCGLTFYNSGTGRDVPLYTRPKPPIPAPPECQTEAERVAYAFGWFKAMEANRTAWQGLTDVEWMNIVNKNQAWFGMQPDEVAHEVCKLTEAKLKEKNHA